MSFNQFLPFVSTAIMLVFSIYVFQRYSVRHGRHFLFWGIGLSMFGLGSFAEAFLSITWNKWIFFIWYLFGAALNAGWIGHGTLYLLSRKKWVHVLTALLALGSVYAAYLMVQTMPRLDEAAFTTSRPISEQYGTKVLEAGQAATAGALTAQETYRGAQVTVTRGVLPLGAAVRLTTPFFNIYGLLTLVGGALYSSFLFWRKRVLPNRVIGNVLIAAGALSIGFASTLTRLGNGQFLYLGELIAAILMFSGFMTAGRPQPEEVVSSAKVPAPAQ